jgi:N-acylneuraminate cytidylyltransferase
VPRVVSIIPARGGSKAVPKKNIKPLLGKPLIAYTIEASINSGVVDRTIVSTDSEEIAETSKKFGAEVIMRPAEISGDNAQSEEALFHVIGELEKQGYEPDVVVFLQCTSPLRGPKPLKEAVEMVTEKGFDSAVTAHETFGYYWEKKGDEFVPFRKKRVLRQHMNPWYRENGAVYVAKREILLKKKNRYGGKIGMVLMPEEDSWEIDSEFDFWLIEQILKFRKQDS